MPSIPAASVRAGVPVNRHDEISVMSVSGFINQTLRSNTVSTPEDNPRNSVQDLCHFLYQIQLPDSNYPKHACSLLQQMCGCHLGATLHLSLGM